MTEDRMRRWSRSRRDEGLVLEMPAFAAERIMEIEVEARDLRRPRQPVARPDQ